MIKFIANTRHAEAVSCDDVTTTSVGIPVQFCFSDAWEGTQKIAIFKCGEAAVDVALTSDETVVPAECLEDPSEWLTIGVYGARPDGTVVIPTIWVDVAITKTGAAPSGVDPSEPTPSWVAQVQEMASDALAHMENMTAQATTLPAGSSATASWDPDTDVLSLGIPKGDQGVPGQDGADGRDATITVGSTTTGAAGTNASVTNTGTPSAAVLNFTIPRGNTGAPGQDGADGADGFSPVVTVTSITGGHQVAIQDATQTQTFNVMDGQDGVPGVSPEVTIATITGGHSVTITDADHPTGQTFNVMDGVDGAVTSVNGQTGDVVLDADDVGAATMQDIIDQLPVDSASGAIASFPDGAGGIPVEALTVQINPVQDLHGQSNPWPAGGGKNQMPPLPSPLPANGTVLREFATEKTFNGICLSAKFSGSFVNGGASCIVFKDADGNNSAIITPVAFSKISDGTALVANTTYTNVAVKASNASTVKAKQILWYNYPSFTNLAMNDLQLEEGTTPTTYAPYTNICPITGHTQATVTRTGKNLFDMSQLLNATGWSLSDGVYSGTRANLHSAFYAGFTKMPPFKENTQYALTVTAKNVTAQSYTRFRIMYTDGTADNINVSGTEWSTTTTTSSINKTVATIAATYGNNPSVICYISQIQLEEAPATSFAPYAEQTVTIDLNGTRYGGTLDVLTGVLTVTHESVNLGSLEWTHRSDIKSGLFASSISDRLLSASFTCICSIYPFSGTVENIGNVTIDKSIYAHASNAGKQIYAYDTAYSNAATFTTAVTGQTLVYPLATPFTIQLDVNTLSTLLGSNNIWTSTNGDTSVTYRANIQKYIQKLVGA